MEAILNYYIYNGKLCGTEENLGFKDINEPEIYEVIRIIEGVPLFLEEHLLRLRKSAELMKYSINRQDESIIKEIHALIEANNVKNLNIKLLCSNLDTDNQAFLIYFVESHYPENEIYEEGIKTILFNSERENPNAKVYNTNLRHRIKTALAEADAFEAILVKDDGLITEGSRSNMFFVKGDTVYTAPPGDVLLGVTRNQIMNICSKLNIKVLENHIYKDSLNSIDGAFMTGTSVDVLPIRYIDEIKLDSVNNSVIKIIKDEYIKSVNSYINSYKK